GLAAILTFAFLREWGLGRAAASLGGLAFGLSGLLVFYFDNPPFLCAAPHIPLTLIAWHRALVRRSPGWFALAAVSLALGAISGDLCTIYYAGVLAVAYGLAAGSGEAAGLAPRPLFRLLLGLVLAA